MEQEGKNKTKSNRIKEKVKGEKKVISTPLIQLNLILITNCSKTSTERNTRTEFHRRIKASGVNADRTENVGAVLIFPPDRRRRIKWKKKMEILKSVIEFC